MIRWHSSCYASYISKQNINARNSSSDAELCSSTPSTGTITASTTRSQCNPDLRDLKHHCFFCGQKKNKGDTKLISIQYKSVSDELAKKSYQILAGIPSRLYKELPCLEIFI